MKRALTILVMAALWGVAASAQTPSQDARREFSGNGVPTLNCYVGPPWTSIYINKLDKSEWQCTAAPNTWTKVTSGTPGVGDVVGPASATDNAVVRFDATTGKLVQNSVVTIADTTGDVTTPGVYKAGDGGVSSAAFQFGAEATLGFFRRGAGQLGVASGSSTIGWFDATGWHGFGTAVETFNDTATSTDGVILTTNGNATVGVQKLSPRLRFSGSGWKTDATATARMTDWIVENQPVQGAADPSANLVFSSQINNGGYTSRVTFKSVGDVGVPGAVSLGTTPAVTGPLNLPNNTAIYFRNAANTGDQAALSVNSSNSISLAGGLWTINTASGALASIGAYPVTTTGAGSFATYLTSTNCADSAGAAACGSAAAGSVVIDAGTTSVVVSTTAVTANSQITPTFDSSLGTRLGVTCNATIALPAITARTAGASFTITVAVAPITNPACYGYTIRN